MCNALVTYLLFYLQFLVIERRRGLEDFLTETGTRITKNKIDLRFTIINYLFILHQN